MKEKEYGMIGEKDKNKKIKKISVRVSYNYYVFLKMDYLRIKEITPNKYKTFSDYIRDLLDLGLNDYH